VNGRQRHIDPALLASPTDVFLADSVVRTPLLAIDDAPPPPLPEFDALVRTGVYRSTAAAAATVQVVRKVPFAPHTSLHPTPRRCVHVWTDGSASPAPARAGGAGADAGDAAPSGSGVFTLDPPPGYPRLQCARLPSGGSMAAEFFAVFIALLTIPLSFSIQIHTDSATVIAAARGRAPSASRATLRRSWFPFLSHLVRILSFRLALGSPTTFVHTKAHTFSLDISHIGNSVADWLANVGRGLPVAHSLLTALLPWSLRADTTLGLGITLREAERLFHRRHVLLWLSSSSQSHHLSRLDSETISEWLSWLRSLADREQRLLLRLMSGTAGVLSHLHGLNAARWPDDACPRCHAAPETVAHLFSCPRILLAHRRQFTDCVPKVLFSHAPRPSLASLAEIAALMCDVWKDRTATVRFH